MNTIDLEFIENSHIRQDRIDNYALHYGNKTHTLREFIELDKITFQFKMGVLFYSSRFLSALNKRWLGDIFITRAIRKYKEECPDDPDMPSVHEFFEALEGSAYAIEEEKWQLNEVVKTIETEQGA